MNIEKLCQDMWELASGFRAHMVEFGKTKKTIVENRTEMLDIALNIGKFIKDINVEMESVKEELESAKKEIARQNRRIVLLERELDVNRNKVCAFG